jgi:imidazoleglycerol-phosphate dehydratase
MAADEKAQTGGRTAVRVEVAGSGRAHVATGVPVLDHLLTLLIRYARFDLSLEVEPGSADAEVAAAGQALGQALAEPLRADGADGYGAGIMTAAEALAQVVVEATASPFFVSNVDLTEARIGGLASDLVAGFLRQLTEGAKLTLHVRLVNGSDTQHVLEAIFKALGVALAQACAREAGGGARPE